MHEIDMSNDRANMAYIGDKPWHGLGAEMDEGADLDQWRTAAGLNWKVEERPALYMDDEGTAIQVPDKKVLVRDDTKLAFSVVGNTYKTVQPAELVEFYRSLIDAAGYEMETMGSLMAGKRIWALARTGTEARIKGSDLLRAYVLLFTGYDGKMATGAAHTAVRVVCQNTFSYAVGADGKGADIRIPHGSVFNADKVKAEMGLEQNAWSLYIDAANALADRRATKKEAVEFFFNLFYNAEEVDIESKFVQKKMATMLDVYENGVGQDVAAANGTAWGLLNAVTRFVDHERQAQSAATRMNSAWFGDGDRLKNKAYEAALELVA